MDGGRAGLGGLASAREGEGPCISLEGAASPHAGPGSGLMQGKGPCKAVLGAPRRAPGSHQVLCAWHSLACEDSRLTSALCPAPQHTVGLHHPLVPLMGLVVCGSARTGQDTRRQVLHLVHTNSLRMAFAGIECSPLTWTPSHPPSRSGPGPPVRAPEEGVRGGVHGAGQLQH